MRIAEAPTRRTFLGNAAAATLAAAVPMGRASAASPPLIAAASDLQFALLAVVQAFETKTGETVTPTFGSSGNFARQIRQGAPFELYLSADERYVLELAEDGFAEDRGALYARGRIVLMVPKGSPLKPEGSLADLAAALEAGKVSRFAIANPEHAPYGKRAEEALKHAGLWEAIQPYLVLGENVSQAAQFAVTGNAQGGIIAYSLALAPSVSARGDFALIPEDWHTPLRQRMALIKNAGPAARKFYGYLQSEAAREILADYGFSLPDD